MNHSFILCILHISYFYGYGICRTQAKIHLPAYTATLAVTHWSEQVICSLVHVPEADGKHCWQVSDRTKKKSEDMKRKKNKINKNDNIFSPFVYIRNWFNEIYIKIFPSILMWAWLPLEKSVQISSSVSWNVIAEVFFFKLGWRCVRSGSKPAFMLMFEGVYKEGGI